MTVTPTSSTTAPATTAPVTTTNANGTGTAAGAVSDLSSNFSTFLTLLTTQLKNQDPTSPMDSNTFTQQLVEYSQVEQQIDTNTNLQTLISQGTSNAGSVTTGYLGKKVSVTNGNASLTGGTANWTYNLGTAAAATQLTVTNASGQVVYNGAGATTAGNNVFTWNGQDNNGNQLADGTYKLAVTATDSNGTAITSSVASAGTVTQIDLTGTTPQLIIGNMEVGVGDIAAVAN
jgi:flagellar basal-body rod modification protein FlgD